MTKADRDPEVLKAVEVSRPILERNRYLVAELAGLELQLRQRHWAVPRKGGKSDRR